MMGESGILGCCETEVDVGRVDSLKFAEKCALACVRILYDPGKRGPRRDGERERIAAAAAAKQGNRATAAAATVTTGAQEDREQGKGATGAANQEQRKRRQAGMQIQGAEKGRGI
jgi:hypothetical protein